MHRITEHAAAREQIRSTDWTTLPPTVSCEEWNMDPDRQMEFWDCGLGIDMTYGQLMMLPPGLPNKPNEFCYFYTLEFRRAGCMVRFKAHALCRLTIASPLGNLADAARTFIADSKWEVHEYDSSIMMSHADSAADLAYCSDWQPFDEATGAVADDDLPGFPEQFSEWAARQTAFPPESSA